MSAQEIRHTRQIDRLAVVQNLPRQLNYQHEPGMSKCQQIRTQIRPVFGEFPARKPAATSQY